MARRSYLLRDPAPLSWAFWDFAYSIFSFLLVVRYFGTWVIDDLDRPDWYVAMTQFVVVLFLVVAMPLSGALADQLGRRKPFLIAFTLVAATSCALLEVIPADGNVLPLLFAAGIAVAFGQLALAQYDPLLADVAPRGRRGRVSGIAVALGFVGIFFALAVVAEGIVGDGSKQQAFAPAGALFVLFALPAFFWIRERRHEPSTATRLEGRLIGHAFRQVMRTAQQVRGNRDAFQFLIGRFFYSDAIATLSAFLAVYMTRLGGFSETEKNAVIAVSVVGAAIAALTTGRVLGNVGPRAVLLAVLPFFSLLTLLSAAVGEPWTVWLAAPGDGRGARLRVDRGPRLHDPADAARAARSDVRLLQPRQPRRIRVRPARDLERDHLAAAQPHGLAQPIGSHARCSRRAGISGFRGLARDPPALRRLPQSVTGAPGRIRTPDRRLRRPLLFH